MRYLTIGILLCAILEAAQMESHHQNLMLAARDLNHVISVIINDLILYVVVMALYPSFNSQKSFLMLIVCWISMDFIAYTGMAYGWEKHSFYAIFNLITLSYFAIQYKRNVKIVISFGIMVLFQLFMILDWFNGDSQTVLYVNYHYILTGIHLLIISTMVKWTIIDRCRAYLDYYCRRFFLVFG